MSNRENKTWDMFNDLYPGKFIGKQTIEIPGNGIAEIGIIEIKRLLPFVLPSCWSWVWRVGGKGEYVGTLPKRIGKYAYGHHEKLSIELLSEIGNIASRHCSKSAEYHFDFVNKIEWDAGEFGDENSCFWSCHKEAKEMITSNGGGAIRFFFDEYFTGGYARAWIAPLEKLNKIGFFTSVSEEFIKQRMRGCYVVFNGYGMETLAIARILATHLNHAFYQEKTLENFNGSQDELWINGGVGFLVGPQDVVTLIDSLDFQWGERSPSKCNNCGDIFPEEEMSYDPERNLLCCECFKEMVIRCEFCEEDIWRCDFVEGPYGEMICIKCARAHLYTCHHCDKIEWRNKTEVDLLGGIICAECFLKCHSEIDSI